MIGRGSRKLPNKDMFTVIDLGNNAARFGLWSEPVTGNISSNHQILFRKLTG
jgi:type I site-specific restriction endonuclease